MPIQYVNTGSSPNKGDGDSLRLAFTKINGNFGQIFDLIGTVDKVDDIVGDLLSSSLQTGVSVTYNSTTNLVSISVIPATATTIGGLIVGDNLTMDVNGRLSAQNSYVLPYASISEAGGGKIGRNIAVDSDGIFFTLNANTSTVGAVQVGDGLSITPLGLLSANFGDIVITNNVISTKLDNEDIVLQPKGTAGTAKIKIVNHALQFTDGAGDAYHGQILFTNPISAAGIGVNDANHSMRIVGDTLTLGLIADFGLYNGIRGSWNSLITMDYLGNMNMLHGDIIIDANNKGIQFHDGSRQTTAYIPGTAVAITPISINPPTSVSTGTTWYDPNSGRLYIYYDNYWVDASPANGGGSSTNDLTDVTSNIIPSQDITYDLGSPTNQWRSLYVSSSTIYIGGAELSVTGNNLTLNGTPVQNENLEIDGGYASTTFTTADLDVDGGGA